MTAVLLIILILVAVALTAVILMQRSEGGALGIGGSGPGGMMSGRGAANLLTRATMFLGAAFMGLTIVLAIISGVDSDNRSVFDRTEVDEPEPELGVDNLFSTDEVPAGDDVPGDDAPGDDAPVPTDPDTPGR